MSEAPIWITQEELDKGDEFLKSFCGPTLEEINDGEAEMQSRLLEYNKRVEESKLRDAFALAALTGIVSKNGFADYEGQASNYAANSYKMADAMLAERNKK